MGGDLPAAAAGIAGALRSPRRYRLKGSFQSCAWSSGRVPRLRSHSRDAGLDPKHARAEPASTTTSTTTPTTTPGTNVCGAWWTWAGYRPTTSIDRRRPTTVSRRSGRWTKSTCTSTCTTGPVITITTNCSHGGKKCSGGSSGRDAVNWTAGTSRASAYWSHADGARNAQTTTSGCLTR